MKLAATQLTEFFERYANLKQSHSVAFTTEEADKIAKALRSFEADQRDAALEEAAKVLDDMRLCVEDEVYDNIEAKKIGEGTTWNMAVDRASAHIRALKRPADISGRMNNERCGKQITKELRLWNGGNGF